MLRVIGGSLGRIRGMDERERDKMAVGGKDGDTATILTTWSKVLPRKPATSPLNRFAGGGNARENLPAVAGYPEEDADLVPMGLFQNPTTQPKLGSIVARNKASDRTGSDGDHDTQAGKSVLSFGESEKHRLVRELRAADERLASVRDGRGYIDCSRMQRDAG